MNTTEFIALTLPFEVNLYDTLVQSIAFENIAKGRLGNHLVKIEEEGIPIIRTTTQYNISAQSFSNIHDSIVASINRVIERSGPNDLPSAHFNHALIEIYDNSYYKMNYHSDQNLDLDPNSCIGLFSCYEKPEELSEHHLRKLIVKAKDNDDALEIPLTHNSVVLFSVETNNKFLHKIILDPVPNRKPLQLDNKWLGITFRKSKTFIKFEGNLPYFSDRRLLELANEEQKAAFFKLRTQENSHSNFVYPALSYTLSVADRLMPTNR